MKKKRFVELVESIREAGKIHRGEQAASRSSFVDFAGSVNVPEEKQGASWRAIKAATWRRRATARK
jgi:hypothetical protein